MPFHTHEIYGYEFYTQANVTVDATHLLLNAPLKIDAGRGIKQVRLDACTAMSWRPAESRTITKKLNRVLSEIEVAVAEAVRMLERHDLEGATTCLSVFNHLWVGVFEIRAAGQVIENMLAYQKAHRIADGYDGRIISPEVAYLQVWHDR